jgi:hypothetical protein
MRKEAQQQSGDAYLNQLRSQRMAITQALIAHVRQTNPAVAAGLTNSGLANKILLQTDPTTAADPETQSAVDTQMRLEGQFLAAMNPQSREATKSAISRMISQAHAYADQLVRGQAPAQQQASLERKIYWMNMAGQTLAGIGGVVAAGGNPAGFVAGATAWDAASAKAQGQNFGAAELGKSLAMNTATTLAGMGAGNLIGKGLGALGGAAAEGAIGGAAGAAGRLAGGFGEAVHHLTQSLASGGSRGFATVPHYVAMEMGPETLSEQLLHHGIHMVMGDHGPVNHPTPQSLQEIQTAIARGTPINVGTGTQVASAGQPPAAPRRAGSDRWTKVAASRTSNKTSETENKMEYGWKKTASGGWEMGRFAQVAQQMAPQAAPMAAAADQTVPAAQALAQAFASKMNGGMGAKVELKNLLCNLFKQQVPSACAWIPDAEKIKSELYAAIPSLTGAQLAQAATALGVDPRPFAATAESAISPSAAQILRGAFGTAKAAQCFHDLQKHAESQ